MFRMIVALALAVITLMVAGCAVGNFIAGAPSARSLTPASGMLVRRCSGCHETPNPTTMSSPAWQAALKRMKLRMQLPASEWDSLSAMDTREVRH